MWFNFLSAFCNYFTPWFMAKSLDEKSSRLSTKTLRNLGLEMCDERSVEHLVHTLEKEFGALGFEFYAFKIGWYNSCVAPVFRLDFKDDVVAVMVISNPDVFENAFLPFLEEGYRLTHQSDPIDDCMVFYLSKIKHIFRHLDVEIIHDFELYPNRRPKILLQTAAHVSGAAYFYQQNDLIDRPPGNEKKLNGVCIHPKYGGWFALRGVAIFRNLQCQSHPKTYPVDVLTSQKEKLRLLELFNCHWQDCRYRDIIPVKKKYSPLQVKYFSLLPKERFNLIEDWLNCRFRIYLLNQGCFKCQLQVLIWSIICFIMLAYVVPYELPEIIIE